ncbi:MAG: TonB-dependent receptor [Pseudomonadota bacterium]
MFAVLCGALLISPVCAEDLRYDLDIRSGTIGEMLSRLASETGHAVFFPTDKLNQPTSVRLKGRYSLQEALDVLLEPTGLSVVLTNQEVIVVSDADREKREGITVQNTRTKSTRNRWIKLFSSVSAAAMSVVSANAQEEPEGDVIVVVGSSIKRDASEVGALPVDVVTDDFLKRSQNASLGQALQSLAVVTGNTLNPTVDEYNGGRATVNLRGVGDEYTLVLLNGRRFGGENTPDIGSIMPDGVASVEILKSGASSIYGSDAVAGVVNVRLMEDFSGILLDTSYGDTTASDSTSHLKTSVVFGLQEEALSFTGGISYQEQGDLQKFDRPLSSSRDYRRFGGVDRRSGSFGFPHLIFRDGIDDPQSIDVTRFGVGQQSSDPNDFGPYDPETQALSFNEISIVPS